MNNINSNSEYIFDSSKGEKIAEEEFNNNFSNLLKVALSSKKSYKSMRAVSMKIIKFLIIKEYIRCIALENSAIMKIKKLSSSTILVELESKTLDFNSEVLKKFFIKIIEFSTLITVKNESDGKVAITVEIDNFNDI